MTGVRKLNRNQGVSDTFDNQVPLVASHEYLAIPSDTDALPVDERGGMLYVSIENGDPFTPVDCTLSLLESPDVFIQRKLSHGYHPLRVYHIKVTGTDTTDVKYIIQK